eukprot:scaffold3236_cov66-Cylindrotheca_fusiformis.AAC.21
MNRQVETNVADHDSTTSSSSIRRRRKKKKSTAGLWIDNFLNRPMMAKEKKGKNSTRNRSTNAMGNIIPETPKVISTRTACVCAVCNVKSDRLMVCSGGSPPSPLLLVDEKRTRKRKRNQQQLGCGKAVHTYCVGRDDFPQRNQTSWMCTDCATSAGFTVKYPPFISPSIFPDYGCEVPTMTTSSEEREEDGSGSETEENMKTKSSTACNSCNIMEEEEEDFVSYCSPTTTSDFSAWNGYYPQSVDPNRPLIGYNVASSNKSNNSSSSSSRRRRRKKRKRSLEDTVICNVCKVSGEHLMTCRAKTVQGKGCGKSFHMYCLQREELPDEGKNWLCESCAKQYDFPLDKKCPSIGYEVPPESLLEADDDDDDSQSSIESTYDDDEATANDEEIDAWRNVRVGSHIDVYWKDDDVYYSARVEKQVRNGCFRLKYDIDGEQEVLDLRKEKVRIRTDRNAIVAVEDPSQSNYIVCGNPDIKAKNQHKYGYMKYRDLVDTMLPKYSRSDVEDKEWICRRVLATLKEKGISFVDWNHRIDGFAEQNDQNSLLRIRKAFRRRLRDRYRKPEKQTPLSVETNEPICHVLLLKSGRNSKKIPGQNTVETMELSDDESVVDDGLDETFSLQYSRASIGGLGSGDNRQRTKLRQQIEYGSTLGQVVEEKSLLSSPAKCWEWDTDCCYYRPRRPLAKKPKATSFQGRIIEELLTRKRIPENKKGNSTRRQSPKSGKATRKVAAATVPSKSANTRVLGGKSTTISPNGTRSLSKAPQYSAFHTKQWKQLLESLKRFRQQYGHCSVPIAYPHDPYLARWANRQRYQYKLFLRNRMQSSLSQEQIDDLNSVGFSWELPDSSKR